MYVTEALEQKWSGILDHEALPRINDAHKRAVTAVLLENQEKEMQETRQSLNEDIGNTISGGAVDKYDPILISLVRRSMPNLMAYDICGVQPMTGPVGQIFAMKTRYGKGGKGTEALFQEADTAFGGSGTQAGHNPVETPYSTGHGMTTARAEALGTPEGDPWDEMSFSIEKSTVTAQTRALKAGYSLELAQDLKAVHGLDAEAELTNILSRQIITSQNRELIRTVYTVAKTGAQTTATPGTFDLDVDSNGRWSVERYKGLMMQLEIEANYIAQDTRMGKGNIIICSANVASALRMAGLLDIGGVLNQLNGNIQVNDMGNTFAGILNGQFRLYIDPYSANLGAASQYAVVGYKGESAFDSGLFFAPYVPLQMTRATDPGSMTPIIGFKTRYGLVSNPFVTGSDGKADADRLTAGVNQYYRKFKIANLLG